MAKQNVKNEGDERLESIETTLTKAEQFVIDNQKAIYVILAILIVAVFAFFGVKKFYLEPREKDAQAAIYHAEQYFENDNFATALNGDGNYLGFDQYPRKMCFDVFGEDKINQFNIQVGEELTVHFDIDAREWQGRWFNSIRAWKVERAAAQPAPAGADVPFPPMRS